MGDVKGKILKEAFIGDVNRGIEEIKKIEDFSDRDTFFDLATQYHSMVAEKYQRILEKTAKMGKKEIIEFIENELKKENAARKKLWEEQEKATIEEFAMKHGLKFTERKDRLIDAILKKDGFCPCRKEKKSENICPCEYALKDIMRNGKCLCGLFAAPDGLMEVLKPVKSLNIDLEDAIRLGKMVKDNEIMEMLEKNKVTVFDFYADWCQPCKEIDKDIEKIKTDEIVIKRINVDEEGKLSDKLNIDAIPFVAVFNRKGMPFTAFTGYLGEEQLRDVIRKAGG